MPPDPSEDPFVPEMGLFFVLRILSLLPALDIVRTGLPAELEHFLAL